MKCPFCNASDTQVKDSRPTEENSVTKRRRFCPKCNARFNTLERVEIQLGKVIKASGRDEKFNRDKIFKSLEVALRKRNIDKENIEIITNKIVRDIKKTGETEIPSKNIGNLVIKYLKNIDNIGYIRYASVYRNFREAKDFETVIDEVEKK